jgi:DUF4097 and DUF4098 domain-containing protein YvlB
MKKFSTLAIVIFLFSTAVAQQTETRELDSFSGVKVAEGIDVFLKLGDEEQATIEVTGTDPSNIITEVSGSYLKIHMKDGRYRSVNAKVYVTYVKLDKLSASSAGSIFSEGTIQANSIEISASSAGSIDITIDAGSAEVSASSAGDVELKGRARKIFADASSAGEIDAYDLQADEVEAEASSGGSAKINVRESLYARASSGGSIRYQGNPDRSNTNSSSGGSVRKTN